MFKRPKAPQPTEDPETKAETRPRFTLPSRPTGPKIEDVLRDDLANARSQVERQHLINTTLLATFTGLQDTLQNARTTIPNNTPKRQIFDLLCNQNLDQLAHLVWQYESNPDDRTPLKEFAQLSGFDPALSFTPLQAALTLLGYRNATVINLLVRLAQDSNVDITYARQQFDQDVQLTLKAFGLYQPELDK